MQSLHMNDKSTAETILDSLEVLFIKAVVPYVIELQKNIPGMDGKPAEEIARNLIAKVGTRIFFTDTGTSKESIDAVLLSGLEEKK